MKSIAIFDIDGTVFRSSLLIELVNDLISESIFPHQCLEDIQPYHLAWQNRRGSYENYIQSVIKVFHKNIKGIEYTDFSSIAKATVGEHRDRTYRYTRDLIKGLREEGYFLLAISHSPKGVLDDFCDSLGFNKVYGIFYELGPSDKFTGNIVDEHLIFNKANIVRRILEQNTDLTLENSIGVGDTETDIPFLEMVTSPICFNPNSHLYTWAKRHTSQVIVERKDVVYTIQ